MQCIPINKPGRVKQTARSRRLESLETNTFILVLWGGGGGAGGGGAGGGGRGMHVRLDLEYHGGSAKNVSH